MPCVAAFFLILLLLLLLLSLSIALFKDTLDSLIVKRLSLRFPAHALEFEYLDFNLIASALASLKPFFAFAVLKTYLNAWTTSDRYHDGLARSCILGCAAAPHADSISHYFNCPRLWALLDDAFGSSSGTDPITRLGLNVIDPRGLLRVSCAFHFYHTFKGALRSGGPAPVLSNLAAFVARQAMESHPALHLGWPLRRQVTLALSDVSADSLVAAPGAKDPVCCPRSSA